MPGDEMARKQTKRTRKNLKKDEVDRLFRACQQVLIGLDEEDWLKLFVIVVLSFFKENEDAVFTCHQLVKRLDALPFPSLGEDDDAWKSLAASVYHPLVVHDLRRRLKKRRSDDGFYSDYLSERLSPILTSACESVEGFSNRAVVGPREETTRTSWKYELRWSSKLKRAEDDTVIEEAENPPASRWNCVRAHPLGEHFTGRREDRESLSDWLRSGREPIYALTETGGMGKSSLSWVWVHRDVLRSEDIAGLPQQAVAGAPLFDGVGLDGVLWYTFGEEDGHFAAFLDAALHYSTGRVDAPGRVTSPKVTALLDVLRSRRFLFILDGFERLLPAGRRNTDRPAEGLRCVVDLADDLLKELASQSKSRILLVSRMLPSVLKGLAGCKHKPLKGLFPGDAVDFFRAMGVTRGTNREIENVCRRVGGHGMWLRLLAGVVRDHRRRPGDIEAVESVTFERLLADLGQSHHALDIAYENLGDEAKEVLSRLAAFRTPVTYDRLEAIRHVETEEWLEAGLEQLVTLGFLSRDASSNLYSLHPVVREYGYSKLENKARVHQHLAATLLPEAVRFLGGGDSEDTRQQHREGLLTLDAGHQATLPVGDDIGLEDAIECFHHTLRSGDHAGAFRLYFAGLGGLLFHHRGDYHRIIELLREFGKDGEWPDRLEPDKQPAVALALANAYSLSSRPCRAVGILEKLKGVLETTTDQHVRFVGLLNLACQQIVLGKFRPAHEALRSVIADAPNEHTRFVARRELGRLYANLGRYEDALEQLKDAREGFITLGEHSSVCVTDSHRAMTHLFMGDGSAASELAWEAHEQAKKQRREHDRIRAAWLLGASKLACAKDRNLPAASWGQRFLAEPPGLQASKSPDLSEDNKTFLVGIEGVVSDAVTDCRRIGLLEMEPDVLLNLARCKALWSGWHQSQAEADPENGDAHADKARLAIKEALRVAEEARQIADRIEFRMKQAETRILLARLLLNQNPDAAVRLAKEAESYASCDGGEFSYRPALEETERLIGRPPTMALTSKRC
jgi:tetratricopeptide (TPR) repeat protein